MFFVFDLLLFCSLCLLEWSMGYSCLVLFQFVLFVFVFACLCLFLSDSYEIIVFLAILVFFV